MKAIRISMLFTVLALAISTSIHAQWGLGIKGEGPKVTKNLDISTFNGLALSISADVYLKQGSSQSVKIEAQQNIIDNLEREVRDGVWKISFEKNVRNHEGVKIWITVADLRKVTVSGSGNVIGENTFENLSNLDLAISGSGDIRLNVDAKDIQAAVSGSGDVKLKGSANDCSFKITGSGNISAFDLQAKNCSVKITGSGDSNVNVSDSLDVAIVGSGDVFYKGRPSVRSKITGSGDVQSR